MGINKDNAELITAQINRLINQSVRIKKEISDIILAMPDNEEIERVDGKPSCFTISVRTLMKYDNWNTIFYDYKHQYEKIVEKIEQTDITKLALMLQEAIDKKFIMVNGEKIFLHPVVLKRIKDIL